MENTISFDEREAKIIRDAMKAELDDPITSLTSPSSRLAWFERNNIITRIDLAFDGRKHRKKADNQPGLGEA